MKRLKQINPIFVIIPVLGLLIYSNSLFNSFVGDDNAQIADNLPVHSIKNFSYFFTSSTFNTGGGTFSGLYYKPLLTTFFSLIYTFFGPNVLAFHTFQLIIHILNSILVYRIFKKLFKLKEGISYLPFFLSLVFLVHPLNDEAVVYVSALQDILYPFFGLLAFWLLIKNSTLSVKIALPISLLLFISLLSKETGLLFYIVCLIYLLLFSTKTSFIKLFVFSLFSFVLYYFLRFVLADVPISLDAVIPVSRLSPLVRLINVPKIALYYLTNFIYPANLAVAQVWKIDTIGFNSVLLPLLALLFLLSAAIYLATVIYDKNHSQFKIFSFFFIWFALGLGLHLQILPLDLTVSDRWFYFPMIGLLGFSGIGLKSFEPYSKQYKRPFILLGLIVILLLSTRTFIRNFDWKDSLTIGTHDLSLSKDNYVLENDLGYQLTKQGRLEEARLHLERSIALEPTSSAWNNLAEYYLKKGDISSAATSFENSIELGEYFMAHQKLAALLVKYNDPNQARDFTKAALEIFPKNYQLWVFLSVADYKLGKLDEAEAAAKKSYQILPTDASRYLINRLDKHLPLNFNIEI